MTSGEAAEENAVFQGTLRGHRLHLEVTVSGIEGIKSFNFTFGQPGHLAKCA